MLRLFGEKSWVGPEPFLSYYFEHNDSMTNKGWKAFKRKKIPLLSEKQRRARLRFAGKYSKLTAEDWENFLFTDEFPKYQFQYPNQRNDII